MLVILVLSGCRDSWCDREAVATAPSPDGRWQAVTYLSDCGMSEPLVTHVEVFPGGQAPERLGRSSLFRALARSEYVPRGPRGEAPISVDWVGPAELRITYDGRLAVLAHDSAAAHGAVAVTYATKYWPNQP